MQRLTSRVGGRRCIWVGHVKQIDADMHISFLVFEGVPIRYVSNHILFPCVIEGKIIM